jgi:DNA-binding response OmpR family regulator
MSGATTIVIVRDDLTIAGAPAEADGARANKDGSELFTLVHTKRPDVIVLDCRGATRSGVQAIGRIRARVNNPILVVCDIGDPLQRKYRLAGAAECIEAPFDILAFNALLQEVARSAISGGVANHDAGLLYRFEGVEYSPGESKLSGGEIDVKLTTLENRLLIAEALYGPQQPVSDRAIDVIVARLRKKIVSAAGEGAGDHLRTEFRFGYGFFGQVAVAYAAQAQPTPARAMEARAAE